MYRCILVPVDGTSFGEQALPHALSVARRCGATLHLAHVHLPPIVPSGAETAALPPAWIEVTWEEKKHYLDRLADRLRTEHQVRVESRIMEGGVAAALEREAVTCAVGLIVMSTHAHVGLSRLWHHGVADQLARDLSLPILLIRPDEAGQAPDPDPEFRHILVPLDGTADAEAVLEHAERLGRTFGAHFTLLRVVKSESVVGYSLLGQDGHFSHHPRGQEITAARQYLNSVAERLRAAGLEAAVETVAAPDVAGAVVERVRRSMSGAEGQRIDLVAVEAHERSSVTRLLFRGTADGVIKESPVPTLLFRPGTATKSAPVDAGATAHNSELRPA